VKRVTQKGEWVVFTLKSRNERGRVYDTHTFWARSAPSAVPAATSHLPLYPNRLRTLDSSAPPTSSAPSPMSLGSPPLERLLLTCSPQPALMGP
jgi:hypothetical protein